MAHLKVTLLSGLAIEKANCSKQEHQ